MAHQPTVWSWKCLFRPHLYAFEFFCDNTLSFGTHRNYLRAFDKQKCSGIPFVTQAIKMQCLWRFLRLGSEKQHWDHNQMPREQANQQSKLIGCQIETESINQIKQSSCLEELKYLRNFKIYKEAHWFIYSSLSSCCPVNQILHNPKTMSAYIHSITEAGISSIYTQKELLKESWIWSSNQLPIWTTQDFT